MVSFIPWLALGAPRAVAQQNLSLIRDAEIENTLRAFAYPLLQAGGLSPEALQVHIVNNKTLNAFVANGQRLFVHTGLIIRAENANQLIGVIAHEVGHIAGGHLVQRYERMDDAINQTILGSVLGAATAVATGRPDAGIAVMYGTSGAAMRNFMSFSREQENAADQAGVLLLDRTKQSSKGLTEFMGILSGQEFLMPAQQDPYVRTHPLTQDRLSFLRNHTANSPHAAAIENAVYTEWFERARAKLIGFLETPSVLMRKYPPTDKSIPAIYARTFSYFRRGDVKLALAGADQLLADRPNDPYFLELKAQTLFESGQLREALVPYRRAVESLPMEALLRIALAQVEVELGDADLLIDAQRNLEVAISREPNNPFARKQLAIAYGKAGDEGRAALALAEHAMMTGQKAEAMHYATRAEGILEKGSAGWLRAQDIKNALEVPPQE